MSEHELFAKLLLQCLKRRYVHLVVLVPTIFQQHFARSRPTTAETETLLRRPQEPHYLEKRQGFAQGSAFTREFTRSQHVACQLLDDVV